MNKFYTDDSNQVEIKVGMVLYWASIPDVKKENEIVILESTVEKIDYEDMVLEMSGGHLLYMDIQGELVFSNKENLKKNWGLK